MVKRAMVMKLLYTVVGDLARYDLLVMTNDI